MKKVFKTIMGGIQRKILLLFIFALIVVVGTFSAVIVHQLTRIRVITSNANLQQQAAIRSKATETTSNLIEESLGHSTSIEASLVDSVFRFMRRNVDQFAKVFSMNYAYYDIEQVERELPLDMFLPDKQMDGYISVQFIPTPGLDVTDKDVRRTAACYYDSISTDQQFAVLNGFVNSAFIVSPEGFCVIADTHASDKFDENGNLIEMDLTQRDWYKGAVLADGVYFSDVHVDLYAKKLSIVCSQAVRDADGELIGVVGMDVYLDTLEDDIDIDSSIDRFIFMVNDQGKVVFSPAGADLFMQMPTNVSYDLRELGYPDLTQFLNEAMEGSGKVYQVQIEDKSYFMVGEKLYVPGWLLVSVVNKTKIEAPVIAMEQEFSIIAKEAEAEFMDGLAYSRRTLITLIVVDFLVCTVGVLFLASKIVKPLGAMAKKISKIKGDDFSFEKDKIFCTNDEVEVLADAFAALSVRTKKYIDQITTITAEKERIGAELDVATKIQADMLPTIFPPYPERPEFDIYASMNPAKEVGGDFYDFFFIDDDHLALEIADVSGKGVPAALFMVIAKTLIKNRAMLGGTPAEILYDVNNQLCENNEAELFVTVWLAIIDLKTGEGIASNAGHEHPAIRHAGGKFELIEYKHSPAVAVMSGIKFEEHPFKLSPGDSVFVYTDGVTEATNKDKQLLGLDRMIDALNRSDSNPETMIDCVSDEITDFVAEAEQFDDITMLGFSYRGPEGNNMDETTKRFSVEAKIENLDEVLAFVDGILESHDCPIKVQMQMDIAVEEIFVNIAHYAYAPKTGKATISASFDAKTRLISFSFIDGGVPFDPLQKKDPDISQKLEDRKIGGLGIYMVKQSMDNVRYENRDGLNILTIEKKI